MEHPPWDSMLVVLLYLSISPWLLISWAEQRLILHHLQALLVCLKKTILFPTIMLYLVPTPVGNLEDITLRALRILKEVDVVLAEDTRTSGILLKHYDISTPLVSHHKFNEHQTAATLAARIVAGETMALISDAGTPAISDPGFMLVREVVKQGGEVQCLPGATAFVPALVASGLPCERFCFEGFLPQKKGRQSKLQALQREERTMIFYESPYRVVKTLEQMVEVFGATRLCSACREISKLHEESVRGTLQEVLEHFQTTEPRGEFVLVVAGAPDSEVGDAETTTSHRTKRAVVERDPITGQPLQTSPTAPTDKAELRRSKRHR